MVEYNTGINLDKIVFLSNVESMLDEGRPFYIVNAGTAEALLVYPSADFSEVEREVDNLAKGSYSGLQTILEFELNDIEGSRDIKVVGLAHEKETVQKKHGEKGLKERIDKMYKANPINRIETLNNLSGIINGYLGPEDHLNIAYINFLKRLPADTARKKMQDIVVPLLEAGELDNVPEVARDYLKRAGWNPDEVKSLYDGAANERMRRRAKHSFEKETGISTSPHSITSLMELDYAAERSKRAELWRVYVQYLRALPINTPQEVIERVLLPLVKREEQTSIGIEARRTLQRLGYNRE